jgi:hypothetical protein
MRRAVLPWFALLLTFALFLVSLNAALRPRQSGELDAAFLGTRRALADALNSFSRADRSSPSPPARTGAPQ